MPTVHLEVAKEKLLVHVQRLFEEMEHEMSMMHQEKYVFLEDICENASDVEELRVAFHRWYSEHAEDMGLEHDAVDLWDQALALDKKDESDEYEDEEDKKLFEKESAPFEEEKEEDGF